jgi:Universal stress protein family
MSHGIQTIVHPTDFSDTSALAFAHALRIALAMRSLLYLVHVAETKYPEEYDGFPHIRQVLAQWQLMNESDPPAAVGFARSQSARRPAARQLPRPNAEIYGAESSWRRPTNSMTTEAVSGWECGRDWHPHFLRYRLSGPT